MTTPRIEAPSASSATDAAEIPWYELISDVPKPPEDAMQQADTILYVMAILKARYENVPTVLWSSQSNVIYDSETPGSVIEPDGYLVFGVPARFIEAERRSYRIDEWGKPPDFVLEVASESTARRDLTEKREIYARMGAQEYWRLDKFGYYGEPLVGERLVDGEYVRFELHTESNGDTWSRSEVLGVDFFQRYEGDLSYFMLRDSVTGEWLGDLGEEIAAHAQTEAALRAAEARNRELEAELERLRQGEG